ncbi:MAG: oxidoreductase family protein, partial [Caldilineaceae bacterium]
VNLVTPKCYYSDIDNKGESHILLIEDLSNLENGNRFLGCSYHDALHVVTQFARFHAQWWETSELTNLSWLPDLDTVYDFSQTPETFDSAWKVFKQKMEGIPFYVLEIGERYSEHVIEVLNTLFQTPPRAVLHFDLHLDNLFFLRTVTHTQVIVVDWQLITRGRGIVDIACFLGQNLESNVRRQHELELLESYYRGLVDSGVPDYSFQDCWHDYRLALLFHLFGFVFSLGADSFTSEQEKFLIEHIIPRNMIAVEDLNAGELLL